MKSLFKFLFRLLLLVVVVGGIALFILSQQRNTAFTPQTIDLSVDCSQLENLLVTTTVDVSVTNISARSHNDISVRINAFDNGGNMIKEKYTTFQRTLGPSSSFSKPVTLPARTQSCQCEVVRSTPFL